MSHLNPAASYVRQNISRAVDMLRQFVAVNTSFPGSPNYVGFSEVVEAYLRPFHFETQKFSVPESLWRSHDIEVPTERVNLVSRRRSPLKDVGLYFHVDTVPPAQGWRTDPFSLYEQQGRLVGLGAADTKGPMAAALLAIEAMQASNLKLKYNPVLLFCTDEEGGLYPGVRYLAEQGLMPELTINFNGTPEARIWAGCFGLVNFRIRLTGRTTHAGAAKAAFNAVEAGVCVQRALMALAEEVRQKSSEMPSAPYAGDEPLRPSLAIMSVSGGTGSGGQIPSLLDIVVSRRYAPEECFESVVKDIEDVIRHSVPSGLAYEIEMIGHLCPTSDPYGPNWPRWQAAIARGFGYRSEEFCRWGSSSCSDFGWVQRATGRSEVLLGGLIRPESRVHSPGEFTTVDDIIALSIAIISFLSDE